MTKDELIEVIDSNTEYKSNYDAIIKKAFEAYTALDKCSESPVSERDKKILYWARQLEHKSLSLHELVENAKWLLDNVC